ncbi:MAG: flagellar biosynthesis protein FlhF, partial [Planctomycetota bacterium]
MKLKTFRGRTMAEVLAQVKRQLGRDAVILNTRTVSRGGLFGFGGKGCVEITAARQMSDLPAPLRRGRMTATLGPERRTADAGQVRVESADGAATPVSPAVTTVSPRPSTDAVLSEVGTLKSLVSDLVYETRRHHASHVPEELFDTYQRLIENAVAERIAHGLVERVSRELGPERLRDPRAVRASLAGLVESMLPTGGPIQVTSRVKPVVIALIGPTGVGKTTTIAKLAANFCLREHRKVGLITIDTYRIAAVEQLKTYAQIIDVPLEVATSPAQLKDATTRMADRDVILIDTAGRSQRDAVKIRELHRFFAAVKPHEVHLVLSSTAAE